MRRKIEKLRHRNKQPAHDTAEAKALRNRTIPRRKTAAPDFLIELGESRWKLKKLGMREQHRDSQSWSTHACGGWVMRRQAFVPPKPKEFESAALIPSTFFASPVTWVMPSVTQGFSRLTVGGITPSWIARVVKTASIAPAAPSMCPVAPLVEVTKGFFSLSGPPMSFTMVSASLASPTGVEVP
mmetsp:Transcript_44194/g.71010  ORF Transcript_44194/g.71010 Transcript_44194/m.71010 type:complete len:184 (-) Transcript_44194:1187-1738(-)